MRSTLLESKTRDLPQEWATCKLHELVSFTKGKQPTRFHDRYEKGFLPYLTTDYLREGLSPKYCHVNDDVVHAGAHDALLIWDGSNAGEFFAGVDGVVVSTMVKVWGKDANTIHDKFLFHVLMNSSKILSSTTNGTSIPHVSLSVFRNLGIPLPPLPEQRKIAEILSTVDETIEKTATIIQETQQLKKGLMQKLFTEGIGHTRSKETKIGRIPEEWEIITLKSLSLDGINNGVFNDPQKAGKGYKLINVKDMYSEFEIDTDNLTLLDLDKQEFERNRVLYGDIFYTRSSLVVEGIGICNVNLSKDVDITYDGHLMRIRPNQEVVSPQYLKGFCLSPNARKFLMSMGKTTTMTTLSQGDLGKLPIALPVMEEQLKIVEILSAVDANIETEQAYKAALEQLKKGLMQVLLAGKVRVKADE